MGLREQTFVVVDTETTGTDPTEHRIIEIGAVRIERGEIVDRFEQLVDPECAVPRSITRLTGIRPEMLTGKPTVGPAIAAFQAWTSGAPLVAHNAGFDQRFLALEGLRTASGTFDEPFLCTLRLARRLLPGLPSKGLDSLKKFYGLSIERRHRAMDDADLTARVLIRLFPHAEAAGARTLDTLLKLQVGHYATSGAVSKRLEGLRRGPISEAPTQPGVYRFFDGKGKLLYVGKARSLRERLRQYVVAVEALPPRTRRMMARVHDLSWETFPTELQAMLHESHLIKKLQPPHNRAQRTYRRRPFIRLEPGKVMLRPIIQRDGAAYHGPVSGAHAGRILAEVLSACFGLVYANRPAIRNPLDRERRQHVLRAGGWLRTEADESAEWQPEAADQVAFLDGNVGPVLGVLERAMGRASAEFDFEAAATLRDWMDLIRRRSDRQWGLAPRVFDRDAVLIAMPQGREPEVVAVRDGLPVSFASGHDGIESVIAHSSQAATPETMGLVEAEDAHVLAHWSHLHRYNLKTIERASREPDPVFADRVREALSIYSG
ncbi:MAG: GIY-YIG nuclease family protein [Rhodothermales bacterium]|nr:GIY-YIG nuclease family protein [Rhodothermales bacterium]